MSSLHKAHERGHDDSDDQKNQRGIQVAEAGRSTFDLTPSIVTKSPGGYLVDDALDAGMQSSRADVLDRSVR